MSAEETIAKALAEVWCSIGDHIEGAAYIMHCLEVDGWVVVRRLGAHRVIVEQLKRERSGTVDVLDRKAEAILDALASLSGERSTE